LSQPAEPSRRLALTIVALILFIAALVRLPAVEYGRPGPGYLSADEIDSVSRALKMATGDLMPIHANKPTLYPGVLAGTYGVEYLSLKSFSDMTRAKYERRFFLEPFQFYRLARLASVIAALLTIGALAWHFRSAPAPALVTAMLIPALGLSSIYYSHIAKEDALAALWSTLALLFAVGAVEQSTRPRLMVVLSAIAAGLACATKYNAFFAAFFPLLAAWNLAHDARVKNLALACVAMGVAFIAGVPYALLHPFDFLSRTFGSVVFSQVAGKVNILLYDDHRGPWFLGRIFTREYLFALPVLVLGAAYLRHGARDSAVVRVAVIPATIYVLVLIASGQLDYQYVLPLTPVLACVAAKGMSVAPTRIAVICIALFAIPQSVVVWKRGAPWRAEDPRIAAARWMESQPGLAESTREHPLLIVSSNYYHYYPELHFDAETYTRLLEETRAAGGEGGYVSRAREFAETDPEAHWRARFLDIQTGFVRDDFGKRKFVDQTFPLDLNAYRAEHDMVIVPGWTWKILEMNAPEFRPVNDFLRELRALPVVAEFGDDDGPAAGFRVTILSLRGSPAPGS
jgi:hypothetical protein